MLAFFIIVVVLIALGVAARYAQRHELEALRAKADSLGVVAPRFATPAKLRRLIRKEQKLRRQSDPSQRQIV